MKDNLKQRLAITTGAAAAALGPAAVQGAVVYNSTSPITATFNTPDNSHDWDVDGDGGVDFRLEGIRHFNQRYDIFITTTTAGAGYTLSAKAYAYATVRLNSGGFNGTGLVRQGFNNFNALPTGFAVGDTLAAGYNWGLSGNHRVASESTRTYGYYSSASMFGRLTSANIASDFQSGQFGNNFIGFRFDISGALHYGWAELFVDDGTGGGRGDVTITRWAYEDTASCGIDVGQTSGDNCPAAPIPNPGTLALLAAGAAGLRRWRGKAKAA